MKQNTKDWIQHISAVVLIVSAVAMAFVSFALTLDIGAGPLTYIGEALSAALALFGISVFVVNRMGQMRSEMHAEIDRIRTEQKSKIEEYETETEENSKTRDVHHRPPVR